MPFQNPPSGFSNISEYLTAPLPFVTQSSAVSSIATKIEFPFITSHLNIRNTGVQNLCIAFSQSGSLTGNKFTVPVSGNIGPIPMRVKFLYVISTAGTASFDLMAGLTTISTRGFPTLTSSFPTHNITGTLYDPYFTILNGV